MSQKKEKHQPVRHEKTCKSSGRNISRQNSRQLVKIACRYDGKNAWPTIGSTGNMDSVENRQCPAIASSHMKLFTVHTWGGKQKQENNS